MYISFILEGNHVLRQRQR